MLNNKSQKSVQQTLHPRRLDLTLCECQGAKSYPLEIIACKHENMQDKWSMSTLQCIFQHNPLLKLNKTVHHVSKMMKKMYG